MNTSRYLALVALVLLGGGCFSTPSFDPVSTTIDRDSILIEARENGLIMSETEVSVMAQTTPTSDANARVVDDVTSILDQDVRDWIAAALADVTGGSSFGIAHSQFDAGTFMLVVEMGNLPEPASDYFYEGWLVRRGSEFSLVSTGRAVKTQDGFANVYVSATDFTDYDFYVLTLEPDDGNPAPAEHILEGTLK
jgi:hypothetical protein